MSVRPADAQDHEAIDALHREVGWPTRSLAGREWLDSNPALCESGAPSGWLLQDDTGQVGGFVGNFVQYFWHGDRRVYGATGYSLIVSERMRGRCRGLIRAVLKQPGLFAAYTLNANPQAAVLYPLFGLKPWPPQAHDVKLSWIVDHRAMLQARALREAVERAAWVARPGHEWLMNSRLGNAPKLDGTDGVEILTDFSDGSDYAAYWQALKGQGRLVADRSPAAMRWRLSDPDAVQPPLMLAFRRDGRITGCAMLIMNKGRAIEPPVLEIVDLTALDEETGAIPELMRTILAEARGMGAAKVRAPVVSAELMQRMGAVVDVARREGGWGHGHAWISQDAPPTDGWSPTAYDGDYSLCLRPAPIKRPVPAIRPWVEPSIRRGSRPAGLRSASGPPGPDRARPPAHGAAC